MFDFVWVNDFAPARNAALARATGDYAFWFDADGVLDPRQRVQLQALLDGLRPGDQAAYVVRCSCDPGPNGDGGQTVVDHIRWFPVREGVRQSCADNEWALLWQRGSAFSLDSRVESTALTLLVTGDRLGA